MLQRLHAGSSLSLITDLNDDDDDDDANVCSAARRSLHALAGSVSTAGRDTRLASGDCSRLQPQTYGLSAVTSQRTCCVITAAAAAAAAAVWLVSVGLLLVSLLLDVDTSSSRQRSLKPR